MSDIYSYFNCPSCKHELSLIKKKYPIEWFCSRSFYCVR